MQRAKVAMKVFRSLVTNSAAIWRGVFSTATGQISLQGNKQTLMTLTICFPIFFTTMVVSLPSWLPPTFSVAP